MTVGTIRAVRLPCASTARRVVDPRLIGLLQVAPHTIGFLARTWARSLADAGLPTPAMLASLTPALGLQVAMDELVLSVLRDPRLYPSREDYVRAEEETLAADALFQARGWADDPAAYHLAPDPIGSWHLVPERAAGVSFEHLSFASGYEPHPDEPGRERWLAHRPNRTAHAWVLGSGDLTRPWLVCLHGFGTGTAAVDLRAFRAAQLHRSYGINVLLPVLPLHGPRASGRHSGDGLMSFDLIDSVHGLAQAVWDVRRMLGWLRGLGATTIGTYGLSLGGYTAALLASLEEGLACVIAGIPASDIPALYRHHSPPWIRRRAATFHLWGAETARVHSVVSPLALEPKPAWEHRYVFAGMGDRMATPEQALRLWRHWGEPRILWYPGGHVGAYWSRGVGAFVHEALVSSGLAAGEGEATVA
jgi:hypothetical protein